jgi:hypothetical protein
VAGRAPTAPAIVRRLLPHRLALAAACLTVIIAATLLAAFAAFDGAITGLAARTALTGNPQAHVAQEYSVLDRAGRLQIPRDFLQALQLRDRVRLALEPGHVGVWPDTPPPGAAPDPGQAPADSPGNGERA